MPNTKDWNIKTLLLADYKKNGWTDDYFLETADGKYGVYIYNINEWRMMSYVGLIAIYCEKGNSIPLINSSENCIWFANEKTVHYAPLTDCLIFKIPMYQKKLNRLDFPFLLIKPTEKKFGFIEWDSSSVYYGFNELGKDKLTTIEIHPKELENLKNPKRTNEIIDLKNITWFDIKHFENALEIYNG